MKKTQVDLTNGPILKSILLFALPILISSIFQQLYNTADTMIVGNYLGEESLAAVGATAAIFELIVGFALGVGNGMGIIIARYYGAKDSDNIKKSVAASLIIGLGISLLVMLIGQVGLYPLLELLGTPSNIITQSYKYIYLILMCVGVTFAYNLGAGLLRAIGDSLTALYILIFSACLNIVLDIYFITQLNLGVQSAGFATIIAQGLSAILCFTYIYRKVHLLIPRKQDFKWNKELYFDLLGQGLSMGLMSSIVSIGTVILQTSINGFGVTIIAAQTTARRIMSFSILPLISVATAITTFTSQNLGAKQLNRIYRAVRLTSLVSLIWGITITLVLFFFSPFLIQLISGSQQEELVRNAQMYLRLSTPFYPILGCLFILRNCIQGLGQKIAPLTSSTLELFGKILFVLFIIPQLGYLGVMLCEPIIWIPMTLQLLYTYKKQQKVLAE